jgi:hypothetical protein
LGFVGTLDHPPNEEGLLLFLRALDSMPLNRAELRVVGAPTRFGSKLDKTFRFVTYLGPLSDDQIEKEAATWACFVHPLFCYARGCSTKLATALAWQIPIATTPTGCRGYTWTNGHLALAESPEALACKALNLCDPVAGAAVQKEVAAIRRSMPRLAEVADILRTALAND